MSDFPEYDPDAPPREWHGAWIKDGEVHTDPPESPELRARLESAAAATWAWFDEVRAYPDRFLSFIDDRQIHESHRRGDATCTQGRCSDPSGPLPACPSCPGGLIHRPRDTSAPWVCDGCEKTFGRNPAPLDPQLDAVWEI